MNRNIRPLIRSEPAGRLHIMFVRRLRFRNSSEEPLYPDYPSKGRVPVKVTLDGVPEATSLMKWGTPQHFVGVAKALREKIGKAAGDTIEVVLWKDEAERVVEIPAEFRKRMEKEKLLPFFEKLSFTHRKEYCRWISEAKKEETRQARLVKAIAMLKAGVKTPG